MTEMLSVYNVLPSVERIHLGLVQVVSTGLKEGGLEQWVSLLNSMELLFEPSN